jgi:hypothetical protein
MSIKFPTELDDFSDPVGSSSMEDSHPELHKNVNDAIEALEAKVGVTDSVDTNSLDYKINHITGSGDVVGPSSATDGNVVLFDTATGKKIKDSGLTLSGTNTGDEPDASTTVKGIVELAIASEVNTGTSDTLSVTPDALAGSVMGTKGFCVIAVAPTTDVSAADGKAYIMIPECMNGMNLVRANASVVTAGTTNATTIDIYNVTDSKDMLSTAISIASGGTIGTAGTVNASYDDVATNDVLRIDVTSASTTNAKGLQIILEFRLA